MATIDVADIDGDSIAVELPNANGRAAATASAPVVLSTEDNTLLDVRFGSLTETAPADDTASSGLNGRLQRIAQRFTTFLSRFPAALGQAASGASLPVVISTAQEQILTDIKTAATDTATINVAMDVAGLKNGATTLTPNFAAISASTSGNNTIVAAQSGKKIRVVAYCLIASAAVNAKFQSGASGTDITGLHYLDGAGAGAAPAFCPVGMFETASNTLLNLNLSGGVPVGGWVVWVGV